VVHQQGVGTEVGVFVIVQYMYILYMFILYILSTASIQNKNLTRNGAKPSTKNNLWPSLTAKNRIHAGNRQADRMIYLMGPQINRKCTDWMDWIKQPKKQSHLSSYRLVGTCFNSHWSFSLLGFWSLDSTYLQQFRFGTRTSFAMPHSLTAPQVSSKSLRLIDVVDRQAPLYVHQEHKEPELV